MRGWQNKVERYVQTWEGQGYPDGIPEEVPYRLTQLNLAPSWKAVALALLKNNCRGFENEDISLFS